MRTPISINFMFLAFCFSSFAQVTLSGRVVEKTLNKPVPFAEILLKQSDTLYRASVANETGNFNLTEIKVGSYILSLNYLGFQTYLDTITFSSDENIEKIIELLPASELLDEVTVTAEKTTIVFKPDKRIVNVGDDLISIGAGTEDILRQIPSVDVDLSGNLSLRNNTNVIVMIDGKRSPLSSADIIAQIPANLIDKIEVITNPSAKYDAEGISGLINIITKKSELRGGNLNANLGYGEEGRGNATAKGNYRRGNINLFANYNFRSNFFESNVKTIRIDPTSILEQSGSNTFDDATVNYLKIGMDFFIDSTQTITPSFIFNQNQHTLINRTNAVLSPDQIDDANSIDFLSTNEHTHISREGNLNYRKEFEGSKHYFELDANLAQYPNSFNLDLEQTETNDQGFTITDDQFRDNLITTLSADYFLDKEKNTYEFGLKYEYRNLDNFQDRTVVEATGITNVMDNFTYKDQVFAIYGVYEHRFKELSIKSGGRLEQYNINLGNSTTLDFDDAYLNIFPSLSASYSLKKSEITTSYTRRISRPNAFVLNPFTIEQGNFQRKRGNPFLRPSFADKIELNYNQRLKKNNFNLSLFYSKSENIIQPIFVREGDFIVSTFENFSSSEDYGIEAFLKLKIAPWWDTNLSFNYYFSQFDTEAFANNTTFSQRYFIRNSFKFLKSWTAQLNTNLNPQRQTLQQTVETNYRFDLSIAKKIFKNKGRFTFRVNDLFNTQEFEFNRSVANFVQTTVRKPVSRFIYVTYTHRFSFGKGDFKHRKRKDRDYSKGNVD